MLYQKYFVVREDLDHNNQVGLSLQSIQSNFFFKLEKNIEFKQTDPRGAPKPLKSDRNHHVWRHHDIFLWWGRLDWTRWGSWWAFSREISPVLILNQICYKKNLPQKVHFFILFYFYFIFIFIFILFLFLFYFYFYFIFILFLFYYFIIIIPNQAKCYSWGCLLQPTVKKNQLRNHVQ